MGGAVLVTQPLEGVDFNLEILIMMWIWIIWKTIFCLIQDYELDINR